MTSPGSFNEESNLRWTSYHNVNNDNARSTSNSNSDEHYHSDVEVGSCCSEHSDDIFVYEFNPNDARSYACPAHEQQEEKDDERSDADVEEIEDDAVEFIPVEIQVVDDSSASTPTVELDSAGPELDLTPSECLQHLHTAVGKCHSSREELKVFAWGAKAIVRVVNDAYLAGGDPFEEGGIAHTAAVPAILELDAIRRENADDFDDECSKLNEALTYVWEESQKLPEWSSRPVVELDDLPASSSAPASLEADGLASEAPFLPVVEPAEALGCDAGSNEHEETDEGVAVDAPSPKVRRRSEKRSEKKYLRVEGVAQRTRSRSSRKLSNRTASARVTRSMVRAGIAELVGGIG